MRLFIAITALLMSVVSLSAQSSDRIAADGGDIVITPIIHSSVQVEHAGKVIQVDPWSAGDLSEAKQGRPHPRDRRPRSPSGPGCDHAAPVSLARRWS